MRNIILPILITAAMTACAQPANTTSGEKAMLNEIYDTKITNVATQRTDINSIVSKYFPIGTSKSKALDFLKNLGEGEIATSPKSITYSTHKGEGFKGNRRDIRVEIQIDVDNNIESITSYVDKSNSL